MSVLNLALTGATGYVGRHILRHCSLMPLGSVKVRALARSKEQLLSSLGWTRCPDWLLIVTGDLSSVPDTLFSAEPHVLIHFAVKQIDEDGSGYEDTNVKAVERLIQQLPTSTIGGIYGSTLSVLGQGQQTQVLETDPIKPSTELAKTRAQAEQLFYDWGQGIDRTVYGLRPRFILGSEDQFVLPGLLKLVLKKQTVASGHQAFSIISVNDYASLIISLSEHISSTGLNGPSE